METAVIGVVAVLLVVTVAIACLLCYFSFESKNRDPQRDHGFTVATFRQEASLFTGPALQTRPVKSTQDFWTVM